MFCYSLIFLCTQEKKSNYDLQFVENQVINIIYFKIFEERELIKRFGADYEDYKQKVSMLFPKFTPYIK